MLWQLVTFWQFKWRFRRWLLWNCKRSLRRLFDHRESISTLYFYWWLRIQAKSPKVQQCLPPTFRKLLPFLLSWPARVVWVLTIMDIMVQWGLWNSLESTVKSLLAYSILFQHHTNLLLLLFRLGLSRACVSFLFAFLLEVIIAFLLLMKHFGAESLKTKWLHRCNVHNWLVLINKGNWARFFIILEN